MNDLKEFYGTHTRKDKQEGMKSFARQMGYKIPKAKKKVKIKPKKTIKKIIVYK